MTENDINNVLCREYGVCDDTHALLWEYACGTLGGSFTLLVESFLEVRPQARQAIMQLETIGGNILESCCPPEKMREDSLNRVLATMDCAKASARRQQSIQNKHSLKYEKDTEKLPESLRIYIQNQGHKFKWRRLGKGTMYYKVPVPDDKHSILLLKVQPGTKIPDHKHHGTEITLVLSGAFYDDSGCYKQGDMLIADTNSHHEPTTSDETHCLCLMVSDAPMEFTGPVTRLLNFMRF